MTFISRIDAYIGRQILTTTFISMVTLASLVLITQSVRLLDLVLQSGAGTIAYLWILALSLPRLIEVVMPASFFIAFLFVFRRMQADNELAVLRSAGLSNNNLLKPVLLVCGLVMCGLLFVSLWLGPRSVAKLELARTDVATQYAQFLFREGTFNTIGSNITAYVRKQFPDGRLEGILVHDTRDTEKTVTILARRGQIVTTPTQQSILVFDGSRQVKTKGKDKIATLSFSRYSIDLPSPTIRGERWMEPEERTLQQLLNPLPTDDAEQRDMLKHEIHRRLSAPFLLVSFAFLGGCFLLIPAFNRQGKPWPLIAGGVLALALQASYFSVIQTVNLNGLAVALPYAMASIPACIGYILLHFSDRHVP